MFDFEATATVPPIAAQTRPNTHRESEIFDELLVAATEEANGASRNGEATSSKSPSMATSRFQNTKYLVATDNETPIDEEVSLSQVLDGQDLSNSHLPPIPRRPRASRNHPASPSTNVGPDARHEASLSSTISPSRPLPSTPQSIAAEAAKAKAKLKQASSTQAPNTVHDDTTSAVGPNPFAQMEWEVEADAETQRALSLSGISESEFIGGAAAAALIDHDQEEMEQEAAKHPGLHDPEYSLGSQVEFYQTDFGTGATEFEGGGKASIEGEGDEALAAGEKRKRKGNANPSPGSYFAARSAPTGVLNGETAPPTFYTPDKVPIADTETDTENENAGAAMNQSHGYSDSNSNTPGNAQSVNQKVHFVFSTHTPPSRSSKGQNNNNFRDTLHFTPGKTALDTPSLKKLQDKFDRSGRPGRGRGGSGHTESVLTNDPLLYAMESEMRAGAMMMDSGMDSDMGQSYNNSYNYGAGAGGVGGDASFTQSQLRSLGDSVGVNANTGRMTGSVVETGPVIAIDEGSIDFGDVCEGDVLTRALCVASLHTLPLQVIVHVTSDPEAGSDGQDFFSLHATTTPYIVTIMPGSSTLIRVSYTPKMNESQSPAHRAMLVLQAMPLPDGLVRHTAESQSVPLMGYCVAAKKKEGEGEGGVEGEGEGEKAAGNEMNGNVDIGVIQMPKRLGFGPNCVVGTTSSLRLPVMNSSNKELKIRLHLKSGEGVGEEGDGPFTIVGDSTAVLAPLSAYIFDLSFAPSAAGRFTCHCACVIENENAEEEGEEEGGEVLNSTTIEAEASDPKWRCVPGDGDILDFGTLSYDSPPLCLPLQLVNHGDASVRLSSTVLTGSGAADGDSDSVSVWSFYVAMPVPLESDIHATLPPPETLDTDRDSKPSVNTDSEGEGEGETENGPTERFVSLKASEALYIVLAPHTSTTLWIRFTAKGYAAWAEANGGLGTIRRYCNHIHIRTMRDYDTPILSAPPAVTLDLCAAVGAARLQVPREAQRIVVNAESKGHPAVSILPLRNAGSVPLTLSLRIDDVRFGVERSQVSSKKSKSKKQKRKDKEKEKEVFTVAPEQITVPPLQQAEAVIRFVPPRKSSAFSLPMTCALTLSSPASSFVLPVVGTIKGVGLDLSSPSPSPSPSSRSRSSYSQSYSEPESGSDSESEVSRHSPSTPSTPSSNVPMFVCDKPVVSFGGVALGEASTMTLILKSNSTNTTTKALLSVSGPGFSLIGTVPHATPHQYHSQYRSEHPQSTVWSIELQAGGEAEVVVGFAPMMVACSRGALFLETDVPPSSSQPRRRFRVPLLGYGGRSRVVVSSSPSPGLKHHNSVNAVDLGTIVEHPSTASAVSMEEDGTVETTITLSNTGDRAAFVACPSRQCGGRVAVVPSICAIPAHSMQELRLAYRPKIGDASDSEWSRFHAIVEFVTGDEISRQRRRQARRKKSVSVKPNQNQNGSSVLNLAALDSVIPGEEAFEPENREIEQAMPVHSMREVHQDDPNQTQTQSLSQRYAYNYNYSGNREYDDYYDEVLFESNVKQIAIGVSGKTVLYSGLSASASRIVLPDVDDQVECEGESVLEVEKEKEKEREKETWANDAWTVTPNRLVIGATSTNPTSSFIVINPTPIPLPYTVTCPHPLFSHPHSGVAGPLLDARVIIGLAPTEPSSLPPLPWRTHVTVACGGRTKKVEIIVRTNAAQLQGQGQAGDAMAMSANTNTSTPAPAHGPAAFDTTVYSPLLLRTSRVSFPPTPQHSSTVASIIIENIAPIAQQFKLYPIGPPATQGGKGKGRGRGTSEKGSNVFVLQCATHEVPARSCLEVPVIFTPHIPGSYAQYWRFESLGSSSSGACQVSQLALHGEAVPSSTHSHSSPSPSASLSSASSSSSPYSSLDIGLEKEKERRAHRERENHKSKSRSKRNTEIDVDGDIHGALDGLYVKCGVVIFPPTVIGESRVRKLQVCNGSDDTMMVNVAVSGHGNPFVVRHSSFSIRPKAYVLLPIRYIPVIQGTAQAIVELDTHTHTHSHSLTVQLLGVGMSSPLLVTQRDMRFRGRGCVDSIRLANISSKTLRWASKLSSDDFECKERGKILPDSAIDLNVTYIGQNHPRDREVKARLIIMTEDKEKKKGKRRFPVQLIAQ